MSDSPAKQKVAILGGGVGAITAAFELTSETNWQDRYEVTVYQMGWRLGGKGASGRNAEIGQRIEEHGLHFWLGFYENAFRVIRRCYEENQRPLTEPLATWREAFKPYNEITVEDYVDGQWRPWMLRFPPNPDTPGDTIELPSVWEMLGTAIDFLRNLHADSDLPEVAATEEHGIAATLKHLWEEVKDESIKLQLDAGEAILCAIGLHIRKSAASGTHNDPGTHTFLSSLLESYWNWLVKHLPNNHAAVGATDERSRRFRIVAEFVIVNIRGILADGVLFEGFSVIEQYDYVEWLRRHGASQEVQTCGIVRAFYDLAFSRYATIAAGTYLKGMLRILFTYRGAVYWKMQAGMGDVIFAPMYEVLRRRGVKFKFFHRADALHLSADQRFISSISMGLQATLNCPEYDPLVKVKRLPCWPSEPKYSQLVEGDELQRRHIDLESFWTDWKDVAPPLTLERGKDFDIVVFGISLGSIPIVCDELMRARPEWRVMVQQMQSVPTQAFQTWFYPDVAGMGWKNWQNEPPLVTAFTEPMDTFADMNHLLIREDWPNSASPGTIGYFCGPLRDPGIPPATEHDFPKQQKEAVYQTALRFMNESCGALLPKAKLANGMFDFSLLVDLKNGTGVERFSAQYFRANVDPSERYVLSVKGSPKYRLHSAASGFQNLYLAGDWTDNGVNAGCVEAAVISGIQAADAILNRPASSIGEAFGEIRKKGKSAQSL
jgi:uncharacterized protein with NAD-binding domain and iron-sulfur cluster